MVAVETSYFVVGGYKTETGLLAIHGAWSLPQAIEGSNLGRGVGLSLDCYLRTAPRVQRVLAHCTLYPRVQNHQICIISCGIRSSAG